MTLSEILLDWYDVHGRRLPWRESRDPYRVWLAEIMLQQTTVAAVIPYYERFLEEWPDVNALANAEDASVMAAWAGLGYYARARNLLACARTILSEHGGHFPRERAQLQKLPGIGPYSSASIAAIAFDKPETVVDGNVERVMARIHLVKTPLPNAKRELRELAGRYTPRQRPGDYAQAVMDLGATVCRPVRPNCDCCPCHRICQAYSANLQSELPRRKSRIAIPERSGVVFVGFREDKLWLLERRKKNGLLGGMLGWPGGDWTDRHEELPPCSGDWKLLPGEVVHQFTHFRIRLQVKVATLPTHTYADSGEFVPVDEFDLASLPTVMRKVFHHAVENFEFGFD